MCSLWLFVSLRTDTSRHVASVDEGNCTVICDLTPVIAAFSCRGQTVIVSKLKMQFSNVRGVTSAMGEGRNRKSKTLLMGAQIYSRKGNNSALKTSGFGELKP